MTSALERLTGDAQTFRDKIWATRVHRHQADPSGSGPDDGAGLTGLFTLEDADRLLTGSALRTPALRLVRDGTVQPESRFTRSDARLAGKPLSGLVDPRAALQAFDDGTTLVFQGVHRYHTPLTDLVGELELELGHPCQVNAYLTPPGAQGFAVHCDTHDVFVVQTHGTKQWQVFARSSDPPGEGAPGRTGPPDEHQEQSQTGEHRVPAEPDEVSMRPGLSLYLPTGTPHSARTEETTSLHVTIGINQLTWRGLLRRTIEPVLTAAPDEHLPAGWPDDPAGLRAGLATHLEALAAEVRQLDADAAVTRETERFLTTRSTRQRGGLRDLVTLAEMTEATRLRRRPGHPCTVQQPDVAAAGGTVPQQQSGRIDVLLGDRRLTVPAWLQEALQVVQQRAELTPANLPLDPQSRLVLCRRLVREGLLEVAEGTA